MRNPTTTMNRTMKARLMAVAALAIPLQAAAMAETIGHAFDVQVSEVNGKLATNKQLYDGAFDEQFFTGNPGFAGSLPQGLSYGFAVADKLWYHPGIVGDPVSTASGNPFLRIGEDPMFVVVSQTTGQQPGLTLVSNLSGSLHAHTAFELFPQGGPSAPFGVYGLVLQMTSPSFQASDPFVIAFMNNPDSSLSPEGIAYGEQAILAAAVPEPGAGFLAGLGMAAAAIGYRVRRVRRTRSYCN
jgi:hypothetical protein